MSGPHHLWSGDWERESAAANRRREDHEDPAAGATGPPAPKPKTNPPHRRRIAAIAAVAVLVIAGIAVAATTVGGSGSERATTSTTATSAPTVQTPTFPSVPTTSTPTPTPPTTTTISTTPTVAPRPVSWLGMEILTLPNGSAIVDALRTGSAGDRAGFEPGDIISEIDGHPVAGTAGIARAISGKHAGDTIELEVSRGGLILNLLARLTGPPTAYP